MLRLADEVRDALADGRPVVALESTIIAHGFPFPENLSLARDLESCVRAAGAVPATVAVLDGAILVGMAAAELERIATPGVAQKCGAAELSFHVARGTSAATTVSATTWIADRAGIRLFATGGIGGVHRGDELDVSSDLTALARCQVAVVSAGAKAILDLPRTLETLETLGVPVVGFGTGEFPAFYSRSSGQAGLGLALRCDSVAEVARMLRSRFAELGQGGVLIANPIAAAHEIPSHEVGELIDAALLAARRDAVKGKALTPYLLAKLAEDSGGRSLLANRALVLANATLAAEIAAAYGPRE